MGFALVEGLDAERRLVAHFWVAPAARRAGTGRALALDVLGRYDGAWAVPFQADNQRAGVFWLAVATTAWGAEGWREEERAVPGRPDVPSDHWLLTR